MQTAIVLSRVSLSNQIDLPTAIGTHYILRRASEAEVLANQKRYERALNMHKWDYQKPGKAGGFPRRESHYYCFEKCAESRGFGILEDALALLKVPITIGGEFEQIADGKPRERSWSSQTVIFNETAMFSKNARLLIEMGAKDVKLLDLLFSKYYEDFRKAPLPRYMRELRMLPELSLHTIPAHMSLVEGMLSHREDKMGIEKMVSRKMKYYYDTIFPTLELCQHLSPSILGKDTAISKQKAPDAAKIWKQLYELRSVVVHGSKPIYGQGDLSFLNGFDHAMKVLMHGLKSLALYQIERPREMEIFCA